MKKYSNTADYLQTFVYELGDNKEDKIRFWMILDEYKTGIHIVTALLPEEYYKIIYKTTRVIMRIWYNIYRNKEMEIKI